MLYASDRFTLIGLSFILPYKVPVFSDSSSPGYLRLIVEIIASANQQSINKWNSPFNFPAEGFCYDNIAARVDDLYINLIKARMEYRNNDFVIYTVCTLSPGALYFCRGIQSKKAKAYIVDCSRKEKGIIF